MGSGAHLETRTRPPREPTRDCETFPESSLAGRSACLRSHCATLSEWREPILLRTSPQPDPGLGPSHPEAPQEAVGSTVEAPPVFDAALRETTFHASAR